MERLKKFGHKLKGEIEDEVLSYNSILYSCYEDALYCRKLIPALGYFGVVNAVYWNSVRKADDAECLNLIGGLCVFLLGSDLLLRLLLWIFNGGLFADMGRLWSHVAGQTFDDFCVRVIVYFATFRFLLDLLKLPLSWLLTFVVERQYRTFVAVNSLICASLISFDQHKIAFYQSCATVFLTLLTPPLVYNDVPQQCFASTCQGLRRAQLAISQFFDSVCNGLVALKNALVSAVLVSANGVVWFVCGVRDLIYAIFFGTINGIRAIILAILNGITRTVFGIYNAVLTCCTAIRDFCFWLVFGTINTVVRVKNAIVNAVISSYTATVNFFAACVNAVVYACVTTVNAIVNFVISVRNGIVNGALAIRNGFYAAVYGTINGFYRLCGAIRDTIFGLIFDFHNTVRRLYFGTINGIKNGVRAIRDGIIWAVTTTRDRILAGLRAAHRAVIQSILATSDFLIRSAKAIAKAVKAGCVKAAELTKQLLIKAKIKLVAAWWQFYAFSKRQAIRAQRWLLDRLVEAWDATCVYLQDLKARTMAYIHNTWLEPLVFYLAEQKRLLILHIRMHYLEPTKRYVIEKAQLTLDFVCDHCERGYAFVMAEAVRPSVKYVVSKIPPRMPYLEEDSDTELKDFMPSGEFQRAIEDAQDGLIQDSDSEDEERYAPVPIRKKIPVAINESDSDLGSDLDTNLTVPGFDQTTDDELGISLPSSIRSSGRSTTSGRRRINNRTPVPSVNVVAPTPTGKTTSSSRRPKKPAGGENSIATTLSSWGGALFSFAAQTTVSAATYLLTARTEEEPSLDNKEVTNKEKNTSTARARTEKTPTLRTKRTDPSTSASPNRSSMQLRPRKTRANNNFDLNSDSEPEFRHTVS